MKQQILTLLVVVFALSTITAQITKTINVTTAGSLSAILTNTEKLTITNLTITGSINAVDFQTMRDEMSKIEVLDIRAVTIVALNDLWYPRPANEIPESAFSFFDITKKYSNLKTVSLPGTVTSIGRNAFNSCTGLTSINIPASVTTMSDGAFWGCTALNSINIDAQVPPTFRLYELGFEGVNKSTCTLHVPAGTRVAYKAADQWKEFVNIIELTTEMLTEKVSDFSVVPNPATNFIRISGVNGLKHFDIYSLSGKLFISNKLDSQSNTIDIRTLPKGVYLINGFTGGSVKFGRFVKE